MKSPSDWSIINLIFGPKTIPREEIARLDDPYFLIKLYHANPRILKRCAAAYWNIPPDTERWRKLTVTEADLMFEPFKRVILALAEGLQEERAGIKSKVQP